METISFLKENNQINSLKSFDLKLKKNLEISLNQKFFVFYHSMPESQRIAFWTFNSKKMLVIESKVNLELYQSLKKENNKFNFIEVNNFIKKNFFIFFNKYFIYPIKSTNKILSTFIFNKKLNLSELNQLNECSTMINNFFIFAQNEIKNYTYHRLLKTLNQNYNENVYLLLRIIKEEIKKKLPLKKTFTFYFDNDEKSLNPIEKNIPTSIVQKINYQKIKNNPKSFLLEENFYTYHQNNNYLPSSLQFALSLPNKNYFIFYCEKDNNSSFNDLELFWLSCWQKNFNDFLAKKIDRLELKKNYLFHINSTPPQEKKGIHQYFHQNLLEKSLIINQTYLNQNTKRISRIAFFTIQEVFKKFNLFSIKKILNLILQISFQRNEIIEKIMSYQKEKLLPNTLLHSFIMINFDHHQNNIYSLSTNNFFFYNFKFEIGEIISNPQEFKHKKIKTTKKIIENNWTNLKEQDIILLFEKPLNNTTLKELKEKLILLGHLDLKTLYSEILSEKKKSQLNLLGINKVFKNSSKKGTRINV